MYWVLQWCMTYGSGRNLWSLRNLLFLFYCWKSKTSDFKHHLQQDCRALFTISSLTTTYTWIKYLQLIRFSGSWQRFKMANKLKFKRTLSHKLDISSKAQQSKFHPFYFREVKTFLPWIRKRNKVVNIFIVLGERISPKSTH